MNHLDHSEPHRPCRSCQEPLIFIETKNGKRMPCDAALTVAKDDDPKGVLVQSDGTIKRGIQVGDTGHVPHWATCTNPEPFRGKR